MANPIVFDAREGISAEALDELRAAATDSSRWIVAAEFVGANPDVAPVS